MGKPPSTEVSLDSNWVSTDSNRTKNIGAHLDTELGTNWISMDRKALLVAALTIVSTVVLLGATCSSSRLSLGRYGLGRWRARDVESSSYHALLGNGDQGSGNWLCT